MKNLYQQTPYKNTKFLFQEQKEYEAKSSLKMNDVKELDKKISRLTEQKKSVNVPEKKSEIIKLQLDAITKIVTYLQKHPTTRSSDIGEGITPSLANKYPLALDYYQILQESLLWQLTEQEKNIFSNEFLNIQTEIGEWKKEQQEDKAASKKFRKDFRKTHGKFHLKARNKNLEKEEQETKTARNEAVQKMYAVKSRIKKELSDIDKMLTAMTAPFDAAEKAMNEANEEVRTSQETFDIGMAAPKKIIEDVRKKGVSEGTKKLIEDVGSIAGNPYLEGLRDQVIEAKKNLAIAKGETFEVTVDGVTKSFTYGQMKSMINNAHLRESVLRKKEHEYNNIERRSKLLYAMDDFEKEKQNKHQKKVGTSSRTEPFKQKKSIPTSNARLTKSKKVILASNNEIELSESVKSDKDFLRNEAFIVQNGISTRQYPVTVNGKIFRINTFEKKGKNTQNFLVIHDNENTAFDVALKAIKDGGRLVSLENGESRNLKNTKVDPNRIFLRKDGYRKLGDKILNLLGENGPIISLHNNADGGNGTGKFNIRSLETAAGYSNITVFDAGDDTDNALWISGNKEYSNISHDLKDEIAYYKKNGMNVVYEYVPSNGNDTSLSNYSVLNNHPYYNIEIQKGKKNQQEKYLNFVLKKINR